MADQIALRVAESIVSAGSAVSVSANFRTRSTGVSSTPSSIRYRVDCLTNERNVLNWTSISAASSATITIEGGLNAIIDNNREYEVRQLTVETDTGLSTQSRQAIHWRVKNIQTFVPAASFRDDLLLEPYFPQTAAELSAGVTPTNYGYEPGDVRRYGADPTGATDSAVAFNACVAQHVQSHNRKRNVYVPTGTYRLDSSIVVNTNVGFRMSGDGWGKTKIVSNHAGIMFDVVHGASSDNLSGIEKVLLVADVAGGTAIKITGGGSLGAFTGRDIYTLGDFGFALHLLNCGDTHCTRLFFYRSSAGGTAIKIESNSSLIGSSGTVHKFLVGSVYGYQNGVTVSNDSTPGLEGILFTDFDLVVDDYGVKADNLEVGYFPPQFVWRGGHINCGFRNFQFTAWDQVSICNATLYNSGAQHFINLIDTGNVVIVDNLLLAIGSGTSHGIQLTQTGTTNQGVIANNVMRLDSTAWGVVFIDMETASGLDIHDNSAYGAALFLNVFSGSISSTTRLRNNWPVDDDQAFQSLTTAATMTLVGKRAKDILLSVPGGATTVTALTSRWPGDEVTLHSSSALVTIQHNGTNPNGFILSGGVNYTFPATGGRLTLRKLNGGYWTEIARNG